MLNENVVSAEFLETFKISLFEPFSDFLLGSEREKKFELSLLDVVRFAGHACPSMIGAFLLAQTAIKHLYPETQTAIRGHIEIDLPTSPTDGATGPMANVFGFITGAWGESGFGGFQDGAFARRNLVHFNSPFVSIGQFRFTRKDNKAFVILTYQPNHVVFNISPEMPFQLQWRHKIKAILEKPSDVIKVVSHS